MEVGTRIYTADKEYEEETTAGLFLHFLSPSMAACKNMLYLSLVQPIWFPPLPQNQGGRKRSVFPLCPSSLVFRRVLFCGTCNIAPASGEITYLWRYPLSRQDGNTSTGTDFFADALHLCPVLIMTSACTLVTGRSWESRAWSKPSFAVIEGTVQAETVTGIWYSQCLGLVNSSVCTCGWEGIYKGFVCPVSVVHCFFLFSLPSL